MITLDNWQREVLDYKGDLLLCTGRRVGKTYILARKAVDRMLEKKMNIIIFSLTEDQAMIIIQMAKQYLAERAPKEAKTSRLHTNKKTLTLKNGSMLKSRPAGDSGDSGRGFDAQIVIIDEAARMNKLFWISVLPIVLMKAGEVWLASTPFGKKGYFWEQFNLAYNKNDAEARYKVFYVTTEDVVKTRELTNEWTEQHREKVLKILAQDKAGMSAMQYGQEYLGLFLEDLMQFFDDELIKKCAIGKRDTSNKTDVFLGVDIARFGGDKITYEIVRKVKDNKYIHIENIVKNGQYTTQTEEDILYLNDSYKPVKIGIDAGAGSLGVGIFDRLLHNPKTSRIVSAMNNREQSLDREGKKKQRIFKEDMYECLRDMMERGEIIILADDNVKSSLKSVQIEYNDDNVVSKTRIFSSPHSESHIVEGLVRAAYLAKKEKLNKLFITYM